MSDKLYIVTGAAGHLGFNIIRILLERGARVRGLVMPGDRSVSYENTPVEIIEGDLRKPEELEPLFDYPEGTEVYVIHTAGIVTIASKFDEKIREVNVGGTENIIRLCEEHGVRKLVHVSSVHAIPEKPEHECIGEVDHFDPEQVVGLYAKTKAEATQRVLDAAARGLDASVVHPSGIFGPYDHGHGHLTQLVIDYMNGRLTACVRGGYDFVDVRDVAEGTIACCERGRRGECYILSNRYYSIHHVLQLLHEITGRREIKTVLAMWFVKLTAPLSETYYKILHQPPLYTSYSLYTLSSNSNFSHEKAAEELGYKTRPLRRTLQDTVQWLQDEHRV